MKRQLLSVAGLTAIAQAAAFFKLWLVARYFGVGTELDAYNLAFVVPTLISGVVAAVLQTGLFPVYAELRLREGDAALGRFERMLFWGLFAAGGGTSLVLFALAEPISSAMASGGASGLREATVYVLRFSCFAVALNALGDYLGYILALRGRFNLAASALIANAVVGALFLLVWPEGRLTNLSLGTLLGIFTQVGIVFFGARATGFFAFGLLPRWQDVRGETREVLRLGLWILPGTLFSNITNVLPPVLLVSFGEGAVSAFGYAYRFHQSAIQLVVMTVSPILLSRFSDLVAHREWQALDRLRRKALWLSLLLGSFALVAVWTMAEPLLLFLFAAGTHPRFDATAALRVSTHWIWLTASLAFGLYGNVLAKQLQARRNPTELSFFAFAGLVVFLAGVFLLRPLLGEFAVPAGIVAATVAAALLMDRFLRTRNAVLVAGRDVE